MKSASESATETENMSTTLINWMDPERSKIKLINKVTVIINMSVLYQ